MECFLANDDVSVPHKERKHAARLELDRFSQHKNSNNRLLLVKRLICGREKERNKKSPNNPFASLSRPPVDRGIKNQELVFGPPSIDLVRKIQTRMWPPQLVPCVHHP
jgi:hypothetical protein